MGSHSGFTSMRKQLKFPLKREQHCVNYDMTDK